MNILVCRRPSIVSMSELILEMVRSTLPMEAEDWIWTVFPKQ